MPKQAFGCSLSYAHDLLNAYAQQPPPPLEHAGRPQGSASLSSHHSHNHNHSRHQHQQQHLHHNGGGGGSLFPGYTLVEASLDSVWVRDDVLRAALAATSASAAATDPPAMSTPGAGMVRGSAVRAAEMVSARSRAGALLKRLAASAVGAAGPFQWTGGGDGGGGGSSGSSRASGGGGGGGKGGSKGGGGESGSREGGGGSGGVDHVLTRAYANGFWRWPWRREVHVWEVGTEHWFLLASDRHRLLALRDHMGCVDACFHGPKSRGGHGSHSQALFASSSVAPFHYTLRLGHGKALHPSAHGAGHRAPSSSSSLPPPPPYRGDPAFYHPETHGAGGHGSPQRGPEGVGSQLQRRRSGGRPLDDDAGLSSGGGWVGGGGSDGGGGGGGDDDDGNGDYGVAADRMADELGAELAAVAGDMTNEWGLRRGGDDDDEHRGESRHGAEIRFSGMR